MYVNDFVRVSELLDYTADEITGMNMYTLCHGEDAHRLRKSHIDRMYNYKFNKYLASIIYLANS